MKIREHQIRTYIREQFNLTSQELFNELSKEKKDLIINRLFIRFADHYLFRCRLTNTKNGKDYFDGYRSYNHLETLDQLVFDLNYTKQQSKNKLSSYKRKLHISRKERFESRKRRTINAITKDEYKEKWEPKNVKSRKRLDQLKKLKEKEQDRGFER
jgi:hypothetical protein